MKNTRWAFARKHEKTSHVNWYYHCYGYIKIGAFRGKRRLSVFVWFITGVLLKKYFTRSLRSLILSIFYYYFYFFIIIFLHGHVVSSILQVLVKFMYWWSFIVTIWLLIVIVKQGQSWCFTCGKKISNILTIVLDVHFVINSNIILPLVPSP